MAAKKSEDFKHRERERERDEKWDRGKRRGCRLSEWKGEAKEGVRDE